MQITVLGAGYVGLTTAALLACSGNKVYVVEPNKERLSVIRSGRSFFYEQGIDPVIKSCIESGDLIATDSYEESVPGSNIVFSCVGTPDNPDGSSNLTYVHSAAEQASQHMDTGSIYVQKSTVPVGTGKNVEKTFEVVGKSIAYVSNPEFLREGTALLDTLYFDRVVAGGENSNAVEKVLSVYKNLEENRDTIAELAGIKPGKLDGKYIKTHLNSAELIKVTSNAFLALKISFANSIAKLSDAVGADINEVMDAVGADKRIGRAFLNAGRGYGGGCFPKDVSGLIASSLDNGVDMEIMQATQAVNQSMPGYVVEKLMHEFEGSIKEKKVAVLGLAFKSGTSDTRRSPGIAIANMLSEYKSIVTAYDPEANNEAKRDLADEVSISDSLSDAIENADAVIIATDWSEFKDKKATYYTGKMRGNVFIDSVNCFVESEYDDLSGLEYIGIGR